MIEALPYDFVDGVDEAAGDIAVGPVKNINGGWIAFADGESQPPPARRMDLEAIRAGGRVDDLTAWSAMVSDHGPEISSR